MRAKSGAAYVAAHVRAANKNDPYNGDELPKYTPGQHCPVTLPSRGPDSGWTAGTEKEWHEAFCYDPETGECNLLRDEWRALKKLHMDAHYAGGDCTKDCTNVKDTIAMFMKNGLACTPWLKGRHFWGLKNTKKRGLAWQVKALQDANQEKHDDWLERLIAMLGESPDPGLTHKASYNLEQAKAALREAAGRGGFEMPSNAAELCKLLGTMLGSSGVCPDCLFEKLLIILEHAKAGPDAGKVRSRPCPQCNEAGRAHTDVVIDAAHKAGEMLTAEDHADVTALAIAHARPGQATPEAKDRLAKALRMAAAATVEEDERALAYESTTRLCDDEDEDRPSFGARREAPVWKSSQAASMARGVLKFDFHTGEAFMEKEAERLAVRRRKEAAAKAARREDLPTFRAKMRVVVKTTGARGVVQCTTSSGAWIHVELDGAPGTTKGYRRGHLEIEKSRKPSARKPAAKKPSKKKARK